MADEVSQELLSFAGICRWQVGAADEVRLPAIEIRDTGGNRLVKQERPFRDGAKLDDTGAQPRSWDVTVIFNNTIDEPGIEGNPFPLYPDAADKMIASFLEHETGDLYLPTVGKIRARAEKWSRTERAEETDTCVITFSWIEDNEDAVNAQSARPSTVKGSAVKLASSTQFSAQESGCWDGSLADLKEFMSELQGLMQAPGRTLEDISAQLRSVRRAVDETFRVQAEVTAELGTAVFDTARGSGVQRRLIEILDAQALAVDEKLSGRPKARSYTVQNTTSLFAIAGELGQDAEALMDLNSSRVDDPMLVEAGTVIRVFER